MRTVWVAALLGGWMCTVLAVGGAAASPRGLSPDAAPLSAVATVTLPPVDVAALLADDGRNQTPGVPFRIGEAREVSITPETHGTWESLADGTSLWRVQLHMPGAIWMNAVFTYFEIPEGGAIRYYSPDGSWVEGPYTHEDNKAHRVLGLPVVYGDRTVIEVELPPGLASRPRLEIGTVVGGYRDVFPDHRPMGAAAAEPASDQKAGGLQVTPAPKEPAASGACNIDVNCSLGNQWQTDKRAVAKMIFNGYLCTGQMLNDVPQDCKNYFLTANHCISRDRDANACVFYWNYERSGCGSGTSSTAQNQTGSVIRATRSGSDFTLLELDAAPNSAWSVYYAGWSNSPTAANGVTAIHHPSGDVKKISQDNSTLVDGTYYGSTHWRVPSWDQGVTEGGSSGSAIFSNTGHYVVGQLHGGYSGCGQPAANMWDEYGKFSVSWSAGGTAATQLKDWLDPGNTGAVTMGGKSNSQCGSSCTAPGAPTLSAATPGCSGIALAWSAGSGTTNSYNVYRVTGSCGSGYTLVASAVAGTSWTDTSAVMGTTYAYVVRGACDAGGVYESGNSNCLSATGTGTPSQPAAPTVTDSCPGLSVSWSTVPGATSYNVFRRNGGCGNNGWSQVGTGVSSPWVDTGAGAGSTYGYYIVAVNSCGSAGVKTNCGSGTHNMGPVTVNVTPDGTSTACVNANLTFNVAATGGSGNYTYQWTRDGGNIAGATSSSYTATYATAQSHTYNCKVTDAACGGPTTDAANVTGTWSSCAVAPMPVADGQWVSGSPMTANKTVADGSSIACSWDVATCSAAPDYHLLWGNGSAIAAHTVSGSSCNLGATGNATWSGTPALAADAWIWFVLVGDDNGVTESSWGRTSTGAQISSVPSGQCGITTLDTSASCP